jgi:hypothetical protein
MRGGPYFRFSAEQTSRTGRASAARSAAYPVRSTALVPILELEGEPETIGIELEWQGATLTRNVPSYVLEGATTPLQTRRRLSLWAEIEEAKERALAPEGRADHWRVYYRVRISWPPYLRPSNADVWGAVDRWLRECLPNARVLADIHRDKEATHVHLWILARQTDGTKISLGWKTYRALDEKWNVIFCEATGVSPSFYLAKKAETRAWGQELARRTAADRAAGLNRPREEIIAEMRGRPIRYRLEWKRSLDPSLLPLKKAAAELERLAIAQRGTWIGRAASAGEIAAQMQAARATVNAELTSALARGVDPELLLRLVGPAGWEDARRLLGRAPTDPEPKLEPSHAQVHLWGVGAVEVPSPTGSRVLSYADLSPAVKAAVDDLEALTVPPSESWLGWVPQSLRGADNRYLAAGGQLVRVAGGWYEVGGNDRVQARLRSAYYDPDEARDRLTSLLNQHPLGQVRQMIAADPGVLGAPKPNRRRPSMLLDLDPQDDARRSGLAAADLEARLRELRVHVEQYHQAIRSGFRIERMRRDPAQLGKELMRLSRTDARDFWAYLKASVPDTLVKLAERAVRSAAIRENAPKQEKQVRGVGGFAL